MAPEPSPRGAAQFDAQHTTAAAWTENRPVHSGLDLRELWSRREVAYVLALRDLKLRYKQTFIGVTWVVFQPLAAAAVFSVIFGRLVDVPSEDLPYPLFVFTGMIVWTYVASAVAAAGDSLVEHRDMVTKLYFPRLLAPVAAVLPGVLDLGISIAILGAGLLVYGVAAGPAVLLVPLWIVAATLLGLAIGLWFAALNVQYRDVRYALPFITQLWFIASPIIFPSSLFEGLERYLYALNPLVGLIDGFRWSMLGASPPPAADLVSLVSGLLLLLSSIRHFTHTERRFADVI